MIELTTQEIMMLIGLCSDTCILPINKIAFDDQITGLQFVAKQAQVAPILARLDEAYPGLMPVPHDGIPWKDRIKNE